MELNRIDLFDPLVPSKQPVFKQNLIPFFQLVGKLSFKMLIKATVFLISTISFSSQWPEPFKIGCPFIDTSSYLNQLNRLNVSTRKPVILVPGLAGSQLEAKLDKSGTVNPLCATFTGFWYSLWFNPIELLPGFFECFLDNAKLVYDNRTRRTFNRPGVEVRAREFGSTKAVESVSRQVPIREYRD